MVVVVVVVEVYSVMGPLMVKSSLQLPESPNTRCIGKGCQHERTASSILNNVILTYEAVIIPGTENIWYSDLGMTVRQKEAMAHDQSGLNTALPKQNEAVVVRDLSGLA